MTMHCTLCTQGMLKIGATVTHFPSSSLFVVLVVSPSCFPRSQDCYPYLTRDREIQFFSPLLSTPSRSQSSVSDFFFGNMAEYGTELLKRQLNDLAKNPIDLVSVGLVDESNVYEWEIMIMGPDGTPYEGGFFKARLTFPKDFPNMPPTMTFMSEMWHPNVYPDGKVCISILHPPGEDEFNQQESAEERWRPILGVEQILVSVISMLSDPNDESPANLDAAVMWRNDKSAFKKKVRQVVRKSQEEC